MAVLRGSGTLKWALKTRCSAFISVAISLDRIVPRKSTFATGC